MTYYELSNHLGNVLVTVTDMKVGIEGGDPWVAEYYEATVVSANDYYPFGSAMAGRKFNDNSYRYGFNGMEKDDEVKGNGNSYDFGARLYDSRVGRWLSLDPLASKYPNLSPYNFVANSPIIFIDPDGEKIVWGNDAESQKMKSAALKLKNESELFAILYEKLDKDPKSIIVMAGDWHGMDGREQPGVYLPELGVIKLHRDAPVITIAEEFFHSFQDIIYQNGLVAEGVPNMEAEVKVFNLLVLAETGKGSMSSPTVTASAKKKTKQSKVKQKTKGAKLWEKAVGLVSAVNDLSRVMNEIVYKVSPKMETLLIEISNNSLLTLYYDYLDKFEADHKNKPKPKHPYHGKVKHKEPKALNEITKEYEKNN